MTVRFFDSFDHYAIGEILTKWTANVGAAGTISGSGRHGSALQVANFQRGYSKTLTASATWIVGLALSVSDYPAANSAIISLLSTTTLQCDLRLSPTGTLLVTRNGTTLATSATVLSTSVWYYLELRIGISDTVGVVELQINGAADTLTYVTGTSSTQDTRNGTPTTADVIKVIGGASNAGATILVDDLYIDDGTTFLGDMVAQAILPNGNGNSSVLVGSDGNSTDNYALVDETTPATADYVESSTPGDKDTYAYPNLTATSGTVVAVQVLPYAAKTDAGARSIVSVARLSGTEEDSAAKTLSTTPTYYPDIRTTKPGGGAWSVSDVNSAEFGVKVNA